METNDFGGKNEITSKTWKVRESMDVGFEKGLVLWVKSINRGFKNKITYEPYELYKSQAKQWLEERITVDTSNESELIELAKSERKKCDINSLYFFFRYILLKDGDSPTGFTKPAEIECQSIIAFLFDNGFNVFIGKPRQIGGTSFLLPMAMKRAICRKSYFVKFICESTEKTEEIFTDKLKFPFFHLPVWMKPTVKNDRDNLLAFAYKSQKGMQQGAESKIQIAAPTVTAINGGSPNLVLIDEAGNIPIIGEIMDEGRPTLFYYNSETKRLEMRRQIIIWGTAGAMDSGGDAFESIFRSLLDGFGEDDYSAGIIPLFLDAYARAGVDDEELARQRKYYFSKTGDELRKGRIKFRQHYPTSIEDMFVRTSETMIPIEIICERIDEIRSQKTFQWGHFIPIFDENKKMPDNFPVKYSIVGATFVPVNDDDSPISPVCIYQHPDNKWKNRYYQGTDPIASKSGHSKFSSAIWDSFDNTVSATLNCRFEDYRQCYIQSMCLGIYYGQNWRKELVEINAGEEYCNTKEMMSMHYSTILQNELPAYLQLGGNETGINKRSANKERINAKLSELLSAYGDNIHIEEFWNQLKSFVKKTTTTGTKFEPQTRYNYDDVIDAVTYAYIARQCYPHIVPMIEQEEGKKRKVKRYEYDENFRLVLKEKYV